MLDQTSELQLRHPLSASGAGAHHLDNVCVESGFFGVCVSQATVKGVLLSLMTTSCVSRRKEGLDSL